MKRSKAKRYDKLRYRLLCCFTRYYRIGPGDPPQEVKEMYDKYSDARNGCMTVSSFRNFMAEIQGESEITEQDVEKIVEVFREREQMRNFQMNRIPLDVFFRYLMREDLNPTINDKIHHDMTAPLSQYFIFTGHNSYLTGNQWNSDCSDEPIIKALKRGVRVIELDIWPNSNKDDIDVLHGRTRTTPVKLITCLESIKKYAFVASEYPVIITLEDHLTTELQAKAAKMIIETFGEILYYPNSEDLKNFPSPDALKHHVLISTKPPKEYLERKPSEQIKIGDIEAKLPKEDTWGPEIAEFEELENDEKGYGRNLWLAHGFFRANGGCGYVKKPNFFFKNANDNVDDENIFNPKEKRPVKNILRVKLYMGDGWAQDFKKTHFDFFSPPDFYTRIGIAGVKADTIMKETRTIEDSWTPCWNDVFYFSLTVPEMALLRIEVYEHDVSNKDGFGGQTCLPVAELKSGIRAVPLHDKKGEKYKSVKLLMRFEFIP